MADLSKCESYVAVTHKVKLLDGFLFEWKVVCNYTSYELHMGQARFFVLGFATFMEPRHPSYAVLNSLAV